MTCSPPCGRGSAWPSSGARSSTNEKTIYEFRLLDLELRLVLTALNQEPALVGVRADLRPTGLLGRAASVAREPLGEGGWRKVAATDLADASRTSVVQMLDTIGREIAHDREWERRRATQLAHRM